MKSFLPIRCCICSSKLFYEATLNNNSKNYTYFKGKYYCLDCFNNRKK